MSMLMAEATGRARLGQMAGRWAMITARWERSRSGEGKKAKKREETGESAGNSAGWMRGREGRWGVEVLPAPRVLRGKVHVRDEGSGRGPRSPQYCAPYQAASWRVPPLRNRRRGGRDTFEVLALLFWAMATPARPSFVPPGRSQTNRIQSSRRPQISAAIRFSRSSALFALRTYMLPRDRPLL